MSDTDAAGDIPALKLTGIRLLFLSYRVTDRTVPSNIAITGNIEGSIHLRTYGKAKNSFKVSVTNEIQIKGVLCRTRHEARFTSDNPISLDLYKSEPFQRQVINRLLPFNSELFAILTSKTFNTPIVPPSEVRFEQPTPD